MNVPHHVANGSVLFLKQQKECVYHHEMNMIWLLWLPFSLLLTHLDAVIRGTNMDEYLVAVGVVAILIILCVVLACMWWLAGFVCLTWGWYAYNSNAQVITMIAFLFIGGSSVKWK